MSQHAIGSVILVAPALVIAWALLWRQYRPVFWSVLAMIVVGVGYLNATGATRDIAERVVPAAAPAASLAK